MNEGSNLVHGAPICVREGDRNVRNVCDVQRRPLGSWRSPLIISALFYTCLRYVWDISGRIEIIISLLRPKYCFRLRMGMHKAGSLLTEYFNIHLTEIIEPHYPHGKHLCDAIRKKMYCLVK